MARFPCSRCGQRYQGPQNTAYPAVVTPTVTYSERLRLCPTCFEYVVKHPAWQLVEVTDVDPPDVCGVCSAPFPTTAAFCCYYAPHSERADLYGRLCGSPCTVEFLDAIWGPQGSWQGALRP